MSDQSAEDPADAESKLRVFLSYSRRDEAFMRQLADALLAQGFEPDFDQATYDQHQITGGISAEDEWWVRIQEMIAACDVMLFLVSPGSSGSAVCNEEIAYARALGKRMIAVLVQEIDFAKAPPRLAALNVQINFSNSGPGFDAALEQTCLALSTDVKWHREGRRLFDRISEWDRENRPVKLLLREGALADAEEWSARRPSTEDAPGDLFFDYLKQSRDRIAGDKRRQRFWRRMTSAVVVVAAGLTAWGAFSTLQGLRTVERSQSQLIADEARTVMAEARWDRAMRFGILAAKDSALSPASLGSQFNLARATQENRLLGVIPAGNKYGTNLGMDGFRAPPLLSPDGTSLLRIHPDQNTFQTSRIEQWRAGDDGQWVQTILNSDENRRVQFLQASADGRHILTADKQNFGSRTKTLKWVPETAILLSRGEDGNWREDIDISAQPAAPYDGSPYLIDGKEYPPDIRHFLPGTRVLAEEITPILNEDGSITLAKVWERAEDGSWSAQFLSAVLEIKPNPGFDPPQVGELPRWYNEDLTLNNIVISPDGDTIVGFKGRGEHMHIFERTSEGMWETTTLDHKVGYAEFSPDGRTIATVSQTPFPEMPTRLAPTISMWVKDNEGVWQEQVFFGRMSSREGRQFFQFSEDGSMLAFLGMPKTDPKLSEQRTWGSVRLLKPSAGARNVQFRQKGPWYSSNALLVRLSAVSFHDEEFRSVAISPDNSKVAAAYESGLIAVFEDGKLVDTLTGHKHIVDWLQFSEDGATLFSRDLSDEIRIWHVGPQAGWRIQGSLEQEVRNISFTETGDALFERGYTSLRPAKPLQTFTKSEDGQWEAENLDAETGFASVASIRGDRTLSVTRNKETETITLIIRERTPDGAWQESLRLEDLTDEQYRDFRTNENLSLLVMYDYSAREDENRSVEIWTLGEGSGRWEVSRVPETVKLSLTSFGVSADGSTVIMGFLPNVGDGSVYRVHAWTRKGSSDWNLQVFLDEPPARSSTPVSPQGDMFLTEKNMFFLGSEGKWSQQEHRTPFFSGNVVFAPDLKSWASNGRMAIEREAGRWQFIEVFDNKATNMVPPSPQYSPDGRLVVMPLEDSIYLVRPNEVGTVEKEVIKLPSFEISAASFSKDGSKLVITAKDRTSRRQTKPAVLIIDIGAFLVDHSRAYSAGQGNPSDRASVVSEACQTLKRHALLFAETADLRRPLSRLDADDFLAAPVLSSLGYNEGDDVCEISEPSFVDGVISRLLPARWWSNL